MPKGIYNRNAPPKERPIPILTELNDVFADDNPHDDAFEEEVVYDGEDIAVYNGESDEDMDSVATSTDSSDSDGSEPIHFTIDFEIGEWKNSNSHASS